MMNKLIFSGILSIFISGSATATAQQPGRFVRKPAPAPEFFVPAKEIEHQEKLPPFNMPEPVSQANPIKADIEQIKYDEPKFSAEEAESPAEPAPEEEFNPNLDITPETIKPENSGSTNMTPKYKQEYAAYVKDLKVIAETGKAPRNQELDNDLAKMNNDHRLEVDPEGRIINPFQQSQLINPMALAQNTVSNPEPATQTATTKILDSVEIIRRPPEAPVEERQDSETDDKNNPFANMEKQAEPAPDRQPTISPATPEAAAHFSGMNPFIDDSADAPDVYGNENDDKNEDGEQSEPEFAPLPLLDDEDAPAEELPPIDYQADSSQPEPQVSRSSSGKRASSSSYTRSSNIIR